MIGDPLFAGDITFTPYRNSTRAASGTFIFVELFWVTNLMLQLGTPTFFFLLILGIYTWEEGKGLGFAGGNPEAGPLRLV
jgi:hypothetical protein